MTTKIKIILAIAAAVIPIALQFIEEMEKKGSASG